MKAELRFATSEGDTPGAQGLVIIAETENESRMLDSLFGTVVGEDGLIGTLPAECRLSDGYGTHYVIIKVRA